MKIATFHTLNLATLATWLFEAGWDHVGGTIYEMHGIRGSLTMFDNYYSLVEIAR